MHLVHINLKYMRMLCKEIFRFQFVPAAAAAMVAEAVADTSVNLRACQLCWACSISKIIYQIIFLLDKKITLLIFCSVILLL